MGYATDPVGELFLRGMQHVQVSGPPGEEGVFLIEYDPEREAFELLRAAVAADIDLTEGFDPLGTLAEVYELRALVRRETLILSGSAARVAHAAKALVG